MVAPLHKKIFMSSPACAEGYDTLAQQRKDSTTFMLQRNADIVDLCLPPVHLTRSRSKDVR